MKLLFASLGYNNSLTSNQESAIEKLGWAIAALCLLIIVYSLYPILLSDYLLGWDLVGQFYLQKSASALVMSGKVSGYDMQWLGGYEAFRFYGIIPYLPGAIVAKISGLPDIDIFVLKFLLVLLPCLLYFSLIRLTCFVIGRETGVLIGALLGFHFLALDGRFLHAGVGLISLVKHGLFAALWGITCYSLLLPHILLPSSRILSKVILGFAIGSVAFAHMISFFALLFTLGIVCIVVPKSIPKHIVSILVCVIVSSPLLFDIVSSGDLLGASAVSLIGAAPDPFLILFPGITDSIRFLFTGIYPSQPRSINSLFPIFSMLFLVGIIKGSLYSLKNSDYKIPLLFWFSFLLLPRHVLLDAFPLVPLHWYRFNAYVFILGIAISSIGLSQYLQKYKSTPSLLGVGIVGLLAVISSAHNCTNLFRTLNSNQIRSEQSVNLSQSLKIFRDHQAKFHNSLIYVEPSLGMDTKFSSPHALATFLPLHLGFKVFPGLLAESSSMFSTLSSLTNSVSESIRWGYTPNEVLRPEDFKVEEFAHLLAYFGVRFIVAESLTLQKFLSMENSKVFKLIFKTPLFEVYENKKSSSSSFVKSIKGKPILWVDNGGPNLREFSVWALRYSKFYELPILSLKSKYPSERQLRRFSMVLNSVPSSQSTSSSYLAKLSLGKKVPVLTITSEAEGVDQTSITLKRGLSSRKDAYEKILSKIKTIPQIIETPVRLRKGKCQRVPRRGWWIVPLGYSSNWTTRNAQEAYLNMGGITSFWTGHSSTLCMNNDIINPRSREISLIN